MWLTVSVCSMSILNIFCWSVFTVTLDILVPCEGGSRYGEQKKSAAELLTRQVYSQLYNTATQHEHEVGTNRDLNVLTQYFCEHAQQIGISPKVTIMSSTSNQSLTSDLPTEVAFELSGHQGAVRAVRFNSKEHIADNSVPS